MRRVLMFALLALALPAAAFASGIDFTDQFGGISVTSSGIVSTGVQLKSWDGIVATTGALGSVFFQTGACLTNCSNFFAGNSTFSSVGSVFDIVCHQSACGGNNVALFTGSFVGPITWTLAAASNCPATHPHCFEISGTIAGMLADGRSVTGTTEQFAFSSRGQLSQGIGHISHGGGNIVVPEPGTLSLLGTGLLGIAGFFRRQLGL